MNKPELPRPDVYDPGRFNGVYFPDTVKAYGDACIAYGRAQGRAKLISELTAVAWAATDEDGVVEALGSNQSRRFDTPLAKIPKEKS